MAEDRHIDIADKTTLDTVNVNIGVPETTASNSTSTNVHGKLNWLLAYLPGLGSPTTAANNDPATNAHGKLNWITANIAQITARWTETLATKVNSIGTSSDTASSSGTTLFGLIKYCVDSIYALLNRVGMVNSTASNSTMADVHGKLNWFLQQLGLTNDTGGSATAGALFAKLNKVITDISTLLTDWTTARAGKVDNLDTTISSRASASTALSNATWTDTRAGYLDTINTINTNAARLTAERASLIDGLSTGVVVGDTTLQKINSDLTTPLDTVLDELVCGGSQTFTTTGTFTVPANTSWILITGCGGGGGGGTGGSSAGGSGGGGAECIINKMLLVTAGEDITITLGAGGAVSSATTSYDGGNTTIGTLLTIHGGKKGAAGSAVGGLAGGAGGGAGGAGGTTSTPGSPGILGAGGTAASVSFCGGGGGGSYGAGGNAPTAMDGAGGYGGYGAGGAGGARNSSGSGYGGVGGKGGDGFVIIRWGLNCMFDMVNTPLFLQTPVALTTGSGMSYVTYTGKGQLNLISSSTAYTYYITVDDNYPEKTLAIAANSGAINIPFNRSIKIKGSAAAAAWFVVTS